MPRRLAQQRMTLSDLEWLFHGSASRAISAVAELLVRLRTQAINTSTVTNYANVAYVLLPHNMASATLTIEHNST